MGKKSNERVMFAIDEPLNDITRPVIALSRDRLRDVYWFLIHGRLSIEEALSASYMQGIKDSSETFLKRNKNDH